MKTMKTMKTLVIHPSDASTDFLKAIYAGKPCTVVNRYDGDLRPLVAEHDRIVMLGHGFTSGLFSVGQVGDGFHAVDAELVPELRGKDNVHIWCYASTFVERNRLQGFATGMFISEVGEAAMFGIRATQAQIDHSNQLFARLLGEHLESPDLLQKVLQGYQDPACPVIAYNRERLRYYGLAAPVVGGRVPCGRVRHLARA